MKYLQLIYIIVCLISYKGFAVTKTFNVANGQWGVSGNWSPAGIPTSSDDVVIPSSRTCELGSGEGNRFCRNFTIDNGGTFLYSTTVSTSNLQIKGNININGIFLFTGSIFCGAYGGTSGTPATIGGTGNMAEAPFELGNLAQSHYRMSNDIIGLEIGMFNNYSCSFDMNNYNLSIAYFTLESGSGLTFYQRTGTLLIERDATIDDAAFVEGTGTTYFGSNTYLSAANQTIPSIQYYNLKAKTNSGYTVTLGSGPTVTVLGNFDIVRGTSGGSVSMANNNVNVTGTFSQVSGSTLNLNGSNAKTLTIGGATISNAGTISGLGTLGSPFELVATNASVTLDESGTWSIEAQFQKNLSIANSKTITINAGRFRLGNTSGNFITNNGIITGSSSEYHLCIDKDYTITGTGTYSSINIGLGDKVTCGLGADLNMTGNLRINDSDPDLLNGSTYDIYVGGSFINNGTFTCGTKKVTFNSSTTATIEGSSTSTFYNLIINKAASGNTVTNASGQKAFQVNGNLTVTVGTLVMSAIDAHYTVLGNLSVAATNGILNHTVNVTTLTTDKYLNVQGNVDIAGTYSTGVNNPNLMCSGAGTKTISCPNSSLKYLTLKDGTYNASGNITIDNQFWAMWNTASGEFHSNGNTITANNGLFINGGKVYVDGGAINVTAGGVYVGRSNLTGILNISSGTLSCNEFNNGDGTILGTTNFSGGTLDVNGNIILNNSTTFNCSNTPNMYVSGDWVNKGGSFAVAQTELYFDGASEQKINVTTVGGTTPYDSDFTYYNVTVSNSDPANNGVKVYYKTSTNRLVNFNNVVINNPSKLSVVGN